MFSRKAQFINCWLVSREDARVQQDLWTSWQTLSVASKLSTLLPDNIIQSKHLIYILYPIIIGLDRKTSFGSFHKIQRTTNTSTRYVHYRLGYSPFNTLHQSHLITTKNCKNQWAQVSNLKLPRFSVSSCWYRSIHILQFSPCYIGSYGATLLARVTVKISHASHLYRTPCTMQVANLQRAC